MTNPQLFGLLTWTPGSIQGNILITNVGQQYTVSGSYGGCPASTSIVLDDITPPAYTIVGSSSVPCSGTPINISGSSSVSPSNCPSCSYNWTLLPANIQVGTSYSLDVNPPTNPSIYQLTVSNQGCSVQTPPTLNVGVSNTSICCNYQQTLTPGNVPTVLTSSLYSGDYTINANCTIQGNVTFTGNFAIAPNCSIIIDPGYTLTLDDAHLFGCSDMWGGIKLLDGSFNNAKYVRVINFSSIKNAVRAIEVRGASDQYSTFYIENSLFDQNYIDIYAENLTTKGYDSQIINSEFRCTSPLMQSAPSSSTSSHIYFNDVSINLIGAGYFQDGGIGVKLNGGCKVIFEDNIYEDLASGIYADGNSKIDVVANNKFKSCSYGVYATGFVHAIIGLNGNGNYFENCSTGVGIFSNNNDVFVIDNDMVNCNVGIWSIANGFAPQLFSLNRIVRSSGYDPTDAGIQVESNISPKILVVGNTILDYWRGIKVISGFATQVLDNIIRLPGNQTPTLPLEGITIEGGERQKVSHNAVEGNNTVFGDGFSSAVRISVASRILLTCNEVKNVFNGINWHGNTPIARMASNVMDGCMHQFKLYFNPNGLGMIGHDKLCSYTENNRWKNTPQNGFHMFSDQSNLSNKFTKFFINASNPEFEPTTSGVNFGNHSLFLVPTYSDCVILTDDYRDCPSDVIDRPAMEYVDEILELSKLRISEEGDSLLSDWLSNYYITSLIKDHPELLEDNSIDSVFNILLEDHYYALKIFEDSLKVFDSLVYSSIVDSTFSLDSLLEIYGEVYASFISLNESVSPDSSIEQNIVAANMILLKVRFEGVDKLTSEEQTLLKNLADQCHITGGPAVLKARSLIGLLSGNRNNHFGSCYEAQRLYNRSRENLAPRFEFNPNPGYGIFNILCENYPSAKLKLVILNSIGQKLMEIDLPREKYQLSLDLTHLIAGHYIVKLLDENQTLETKSIIIIR